MRLYLKVSYLIYITYNIGNTIKWSDFKANNKDDWDYTSDKLHNTYILEKNIKIWNTIGKKICDYYTEKGNKITFTEYTEYTENHLGRNHLILALDESGKYIKLFYRFYEWNFME